MNHLIALLGVLGISLAAIFFRMSTVSPATAALFRALYALPLLMWMARHHKASPRFRMLAFAGGLLFGLDLVCWHAAIERMGAGLATVMANTQVAWVGVGAWAIQGERPPLRFLAVLPLMLGGVALLAGLGDHHAFGIDPVTGALFGLAGALAYAGYLLVHRRACRGDPWPTGPLRDATAGVAVAALALGLLGDPAFSLHPTWPAHGWLLVLAVVVQAGGWFALSVALPRLAAVEGSTLLLLQPVGTLLWGTLLFAEAPSVRQWLGAAVVLAGLAVVQFGGRAVANTKVPFVQVDEFAKDEAAK